MSSQPGKRLADRRILITGGASGIGRATAELFLQEGARVALFDMDQVAVDRACKDLGCFASVVDVTDSAGVTAAVAAAAEALGGLDGLVNCAGTFVAGRLGEADLEGWLRNIAVNLNGPFIVASACLPYLREATGDVTIVNVSSGIALRPGPAQGAYAASKAGLLAWTKVLAQELGPEIRVNATAPGPTDTPLMQRNAGGRTMAALGEGRALARAGEPLEQAQAILFLTGPESTFVTGITIPVDGGRAYL